MVTDGEAAISHLGHTATTLETLWIVAEVRSDASCCSLLPRVMKLVRDRTVTPTPGLTGLSFPYGKHGTAFS